MALPEAYIRRRMGSEDAHYGVAHSVHDIVASGPSQQNPCPTATRACSAPTAPSSSSRPSTPETSSRLADAS